MSYLRAVGDHRCGSSALRDGSADVATARTVGRVLARIHGHSAARPELAAQFDTDAIFFDIRLEPYLLATARTPRRRSRRRWSGWSTATQCACVSRWCTATSARRTS